MKRIKQWSILGGSGFLLLLLLAVFIYRDDVFQSLNDPGIPFQTYQPPSPLDYAEVDSWLSYPDVRNDEATGPANIFVVTPTQFLGRSGWNAPMSDEAYRLDVERRLRPNYVAPYFTVGNVYAPFYREAALYALLTNRDDAMAARKLAAADIDRAFRQYLSETAEERPIILVGYEQGGLYIEKILQDYFSGDNPQAVALRKRLAAAYIIDYPVPTDLFEDQLSGLMPCDAADAVQCVVSFGTFTQTQSEAARQFTQDWQSWDDDRFETVKDRPLLCVNPLSWDLTSDYVPARLHKGAVAAEGMAEDEEPAPSPRQFGAQCEDGLLIIDTPAQRSLRRPVRFGGKFIPPARNLFYLDLRENALRRSEALQDTGDIPVRAEPFGDIQELDEAPITLVPDQ